MKKIISLFFIISQLFTAECSVNSIDSVITESTSPIHNVLSSDLFAMMDGNDFFPKYLLDSDNSSELNRTIFTFVSDDLLMGFYHSKVRIDLRYREFISNPGPPIFN